MKDIKYLAAVAGVLLLLAGSVWAVTGSIRPARIIAYPSVNVWEINTFEYQIEIGNPGTIPSTVTLAPSGNLKDYTDLSETYVELGVGEYKTINVTFILHDAIMKTGSIMMSFSDGVSGVGLETEVKLYPSSNGTADNQAGPTAPVITAPAEGQALCSDRATLEWDASTDSDTAVIAYEWQVDNNNDFSSLLDEGITVKTSKTIMVDEGKTYFWRVRAYDGSHYSDWANSSFKVNKIWECLGQSDACEARLDDVESRVSVLEVLVSMIKDAICTVHDFGFCSEPETCGQTDTSCGTPPCMDCNVLDGCYDGYQRDYYCGSGSCSAYTSQCTETCCDQFYQDADAYCLAGVCHEPQVEPGCTDDCTLGDTRCTDSVTIQSCGNFDADSCTEWGDDEICEYACQDGACITCFPEGTDCESDSDCCSGDCHSEMVCAKRNWQGFCTLWKTTHTCT
jgi:hypothetical protein